MNYLLSASVDILVCLQTKQNSKDVSNQSQKHAKIMTVASLSLKSIRLKTV